jgi:hypothetical protein
LSEWEHPFFLLVLIGKDEEEIEPKNFKENGYEGAGE